MTSRLFMPERASAATSFTLGKLTQVETFRVGCIGAIDANEMRNVVSAVAATLQDMGIRQVAPAGKRKAA